MVLRIQGMKIKAFYLSLLFILGLIPAISQAGVLTQTFNTSWTVSPWNYYGDVAAMEWTYIPYQPFDHSLGTLTKVQADTHFSGSRLLSTDDLKVRYAFATGWNPAQYQLYNEVLIPSGTFDFTFDNTKIFDNALSLQSWNDPLYLPQATYYFESRTVSGAHSISATTNLTYFFDSPVSVPESASMYLMALGLLGFGAFRKFNKNSKRA